MQKLVASKIVYIVNEILHDLEMNLRRRNAADVFSNGNCALMPELYRLAGLKIRTVYGQHLETKENHFVSAVDSDLPGWNAAKGIYDIKCCEDKPFFNATEWKLGLFKDEKDPYIKKLITEASYNYPYRGKDKTFLESLPERLRMKKTKCALKSKLDKYNMLDMKRDPASGLYLSK